MCNDDKPIIIPVRSVGNAQVPVKESARMPGVKVNDTMVLEQQVSSVSTVCFHQMTA